MDTVITKEFVKEFLEYLRLEKKIHKKYVWIILKRIIEILDKEKNIVNISFEENPRMEELTVCGDVHG